uniref:Uncharacterized protein n=1 Tax=Amphimedon queenslandica TaxID=400682 RepID=A0A1X7VVN0_AMPQE
FKKWQPNCPNGTMEVSTMSSLYLHWLKLLAMLVLSHCYHNKVSNIFKRTNIQKKKNFWSAELIGHRPTQAHP